MSRICSLFEELFFLSQRQIERSWMLWMLIPKSFSTLFLGFAVVDHRSNMQFDDDIEETANSRPILDAIEYIIDAREWDVPYHIRVAIDKGISIQKFQSNQRHSNRKMVY